MNPSEYLQAEVNKTEFEPDIGVILGSGIGQITERIDIDLEVSYEDVPQLIGSTVEGHEGRYIVGTIDDTAVICMDGRLHYYETGDIDEVVKPLKTMCELGLENLIVTNAAGGVNDEYEPGDVMILNDHINVIGTNPLIGHSDDYPGEMFPDQTEAYDRQMIQKAEKVSEKYSLDIHNGVYVAMTGPTYETPAEVNMISTIGGDAIGMSTVPEVIVANQYDIDVFALSTVTSTHH